MKIGIVAALPEEISTLTQHKLAQGACIAISDTVLIAHAGAGPDNARLAVRLLTDNNVDAIISWGCAAALQADIKPGTLALPSELISAELQNLSLQSQWQQLCLTNLSSHFNIMTGKLAESHSIISSSYHKKSLHQQTGAQLLDMESIAIAKAADTANLPCLVIRAIVDPVDMDLPRAINHAMNKQGSIEIKKLLLYVLVHPSEISGLIRLGIHFKAAKKTLKSVAKHLDNLTAINLSAATHG